MDKENIIKFISKETIEIKKKFLALNTFYTKSYELTITDLDENDKFAAIMLSYFSYYERFVKIIYDKIFNFINHLKKREKIYPKEFDSLAFLYCKIGEKKNKIRQFQFFMNQKFLDSFNVDKFFKDNQKLENIRHLLELNCIIANTQKEEYITAEFYSSVGKVENLDINGKLEKLEELYKLRNDRIHGSFVMQTDEIKDIFELFNFSITILSNSIIDVLEKNF
ncbi:hypothetical protein [Fusobacterium ulcerans]|uniref:Uncharacterized protein n=1 Tax=Fusobacterium ulcerans 12-1B TaxID=457404 RepID=S2LPU5_9FUSO|nr:hypothetical protein [Fusobacterium ulcerans]EPC09048.1 hypothetical protein HMPREF0402_04226 [Fusobacterium ulcerans 12-1B]